MPKPEWWVLSLNQLVSIFRGPFMFIGTAAIPGGLAALLMALPFLDRSPERHPAQRKTGDGCGVHDPGGDGGSFHHGLYGTLRDPAPMRSGSYRDRLPRIEAPETIIRMERALSSVIRSPKKSPISVTTTMLPPMMMGPPMEI